MTVPIQHIQEELNIAYASAVIARAGYTSQVIRQDYGVDLCVRRVQNLGGRRIDMGGVLDCQLKASTSTSPHKF